MTGNSGEPIRTGSGPLRERHNEIEIHRDVRIPTADPEASLSADVYRPVGTGPVPALVTVLPYRKDAGSGIECDPSLRWFASRGYAALLVDFRGTGSSDGRQRPPFDPSEADDGVAAIEWAAAQRWCDGNVGMWGASYGAIMSMRTAGHRPPHLKAIVPILGALDLERDFTHPSGSRGCFASLAMWRTETLLNQLLPPLHGYATTAEQRRWQDRLQAEPWLLDLFRHGPGDPVWRSRAVDASAISVPAFCVAGWRDLFCDSSIRAYELIDAPKKLLAGPWMHVWPEDSPVAPVDFRGLALRWWDHWLRGIDDGLMDEPPVTVYIQGASQPWRRYEAWPPPGKLADLATAGSTRLAPANDGTGTAPARERSTVIAKYEPDATVGPLSGLWAMPASGVGLPLDQHDDDMRSLTCTGAPLADDLTVAGRPKVTVRLADGPSPGRLVVRLADVDSESRSTLICAGTIPVPEPAGTHQVTLAPTCYRVAAGHRLRIVLGDADFPRLWPLTTSPQERVLLLAAATLWLPVVADTDGKIVDLPVPDEPPGEPAPLGVRLQPQWTITRDLVKDSVEVAYGQEITAVTADREHLLELRHRTAASVAQPAPAAACAQATTSATARMATGETIDVRVAAHLTETRLIATGQVDIDGVTVFSRQWEA
jgi:putative CocE/NonD family hydrolase